MGSERRFSSFKASRALLVGLTTISKKRKKPRKRDGRHFNAECGEVSLEARQLLPDEVLQHALVGTGTCG